MKKFIKRLLLASIIILIIKLLIFIPVIYSLKNDPKTYYGNSTNKSKIILVGASNIEHNYDYDLLNKTFNDYNVIGCCLNASSGIYPTLCKLKDLNPNSNDIIIFCLPHSYYEESGFFPIRRADKTGVSFEVLKQFIFDFPFLFIKKLFFLKVNDSYSLLTNKRIAVNKYTNSLIFYKHPKVQSEPKYNNCWCNREDKFHITSTTFEKEHIEKLFKYISTEFRGQIFFRYPPVKTEDYQINQNRISFLSHRGFFINDFASSLYEQKYWFNQWYHLNRCGRDLCTQKLIKELNHNLHLSTRVNESVPTSKLLLCKKQHSLKNKQSHQLKPTRAN